MANYSGPRNNEIKTYVEDELVSDIDELAENMFAGMSRSQMMRYLLIQGIANVKRVTLPLTA